MLDSKVNPYDEERLAKDAMRAIDNTLAMIAGFDREDVAVSATAMSVMAEQQFKETTFGVMIVCAASLLMAAASGRLVRKGAEDEVSNRTEGKPG